MWLAQQEADARAEGDALKKAVAAYLNEAGNEDGDRPQASW